LRRLSALAVAAALAAAGWAALPGTAASSEVSRAGEAGKEYREDLDYAQVLFVEAVESGDGRWCIYTTVRHNDEGWEHYAVLWEVLDPEGKEIAWRALAHPHVEEQPFERDQCRVTFPRGITRFRVRAKCNVHGFGGREVSVDLTVPEGEGFRVVRSGRE
jgi:hypothetical protein